MANSPSTSRPLKPAGVSGDSISGAELQVGGGRVDPTILRELVREHQGDMAAVIKEASDLHERLDGAGPMPAPSATPAAARTPNRR